MTLSQRLTRAGLTLVLFGGVAALMPENSSALAVPAICGPTTVYALSESPTGPTLTAATLHAGGRDILYAIQSVNGGAYTPISGQAIVSGGGGAVQAGAATNSSGAVRVNTIFIGNGTVSATFPDSTTGTFTYNVGP